MKSEKNQNVTSATSVFKAIDNVLKKPGCGCSGSLDYMEQSSWLLFLRKGKETKKPINYYQLDLKGASLGKTRPLNEDDLAEFEKLSKAREGVAVCETMRKAILKEAFDDGRA